MSLRCVKLLAAAILLAVNDTLAVSCNGNRLAMEASNEGRSDGEHTTENSFARSLRRLDTSGDEEERDLFGIFAKSNLKKMMKSESFKHTMFGNWDGFTVGHIRTKLKDKYPELLLDYLNVYKKGGDEVVRHAKNPNKVKFANKPTIRFES